MSKHYFYDYKNELHDQLTKKFKNELNALKEERNRQSQLDTAEKIIRNYFEELVDSLADIILISDNKVQMTSEGSKIVKFTLFDNYLKFTRFDHAIEVEIGIFDETTRIVEARIISNIIPGDKRCVVKRIGKVHDGAHFDDKTINFYMQEAFGDVHEV